MRKFGVDRLEKADILTVLIHTEQFAAEWRWKGGGTVLHLDYRDPRPIYEQVKEGLKRLILTGGLAEGEKLPSVRSLAASLAINPNTIQRAYEALEQEGFICTAAGKGSFAARPQGGDPARRERLWRQFDEAAAELLFSGVKGDEMHARIARLEGGETA